MEYEKGWLSRQFDLAKEYYNSLPEWKKTQMGRKTIEVDG